MTPEYYVFEKLPFPEPWPDPPAWAERRRFKRRPPEILEEAPARARSRENVSRHYLIQESCGVPTNGKAAPYFEADADDIVCAICDATDCDRDHARRIVANA